MENVIRGFAKNHSKMILHFFGNKKKFLHPKRIHKFRLTMKKVKALQRLMDRISEVNDHRVSLLPLNKIYKISGKLRDCQIQKSLADSALDHSTKEAKALFKWLSNEQKKATRLLVRAYTGIHPEQIENTLNNYIDFITECSHQISTEQCISFVRQEIDVITLISGKQLDDKTLHQIRKHVKDVIYALDLLVKDGSTTSIASSGCSWWNELQEELGVMNDWANFERALRRKNNAKPQFREMEWIVGVEKQKFRNKLQSKLLYAMHNRMN